MGKVYAYIRVSDIAKQDSFAQRKVIEDYAKENNLSSIEWLEHHISGSKSCRDERGIISLLDVLNIDDVVLVSDIARLGRDDIHSVINTITTITTKGASLYLCYSNTKIKPEDKNDLAKIFIAIGDAYAAVRFSEERSQKAKAAIIRRKSQGLHVGRKHGQVVKSKLDEHTSFILNHLDLGTKKSDILKLLLSKDVSVSRAQLYRWISKTRTVFVD